MSVRALTVRPGQAGSARLDERADPVPAAGEIVVETSLVGVCGTDRELVEGSYGRAPAGQDRLVIGHESVGRVVSAPPPDSGLSLGDAVVPMVRHPDPVPCPSCAVGEWDMCQNGQYLEHGIVGLDGFASDRYAIAADRVVVVPASLGDLGVLVEPASVVAKAWEQIYRIGNRTTWTPRTALIVGAGPVGLLAALLARQRGLRTHVVDVVETGPKPDLVVDLGAEYHVGRVADACPLPDVIVECTGIGSVVLEAMAHNRPNGIVCLVGLSGRTRTLDLDAGELNRRMVLDNDVVFGTVNANERHYRAAVDALAAADPEWLGRLITRRAPLADWAEALIRQPDDVKVAIRVGPRADDVADPRSNSLLWG
jgi:threonine dehydrogenase-like Zn-dependent dehydrogenase